jgi:sulfur carrier protein
MKITLNGQPHQTQATTIAALLQELGTTTNGVAVGVAVAVNESVVRRADHPHHRLNENDVVEVIRAVQGG